MMNNSESDLEIPEEDVDLFRISDELFLESYDKKNRAGIENCIWHGIDCVDFGQYDEAINFFNAGLELDPDITDFWLFKVFCYKWMNSPIDTKEYLKKINWDMIVIHAQRLYRKCQFKRALRYFEIAIEINPSDPDFWDNKGSCLEQLGRPDEATKCYNRAKELEKILPR